MSITLGNLGDVIAMATEVYDNSTSFYDNRDYFIHPHWKQFGQIPDLWHNLVGIYITIVGITGIIGNSVVIWIFSTTRTLKTPSNMFIINLALSDLTFSAVNGFPLFSISAFNKRWMWGDAACQFYGFIGGLFGLMSINTLAAISFDRYLNIAKPLSAAKNMTRKKAFMMIVLVWVWSLIWSVPPLFGWGAYIPEGFQTSCTFDYLSTEPHMRSFIFGMYIGDFAVPLAIIIISYLLILKAIRKHEKEMSKVVDKLKADDPRNKQDKLSMEIKVARIAMLIIFLYILSWSPYATVALIGQFGPTEWVTPLVSELPVLLAKTCAMHNPIVYAFSHPKFREALVNRVPWLSGCLSVKPTDSSSKVSSNPRGGKMPLSRNMSSDSNYYGSEASSYVSNLDESGHHKSIPDVSRAARDPASNQIIMELVRALVSVVNRNTPQATSETNIDLSSMGEAKQEEISKCIAKILKDQEKPSTGAEENKNKPPAIVTPQANATERF